MDIELHYKEAGTGEPLILLHGNGGDGSYFQEQMGPLSEHFRVMALDTRGYGGSPRGKKPFTLHQFAEDLEEFLKEQKIEKAHLLGFSDGGNIAMLFAMRHPDRVKRLILNGANLNPAGVKRSIQIPIELGYRIAKLFSAGSDSARLHAEMLGLMVNEPDVKPEELAGIQAKTLVIAGTDDMITEAHTRLIAAGIPGSRLVLIQGSHFIAHEKPEAFNRAVLDFLRGN